MRRRLGRGLAFAVAGLLGVGIPVALAGGWGSGATYLSTDTGAQTQESPAVAVSGDGDVAALWLDQGTATTPGTATLDATSDTGTGFGTVAEVSTTADPLAAFNNTDYPQVAEDAAGDTLAVWISNGSVEAGYRAAGASGFTDSTVDSTSYPAQDQFPQLAMDPAGDAVVTWQQYENEYGTWSIHYAVLSAGSSTLTAEPALQSGMPISESGQPDPHVAVNSSGAAVIVWVDVNSEAIDYAYSSSLTSPGFTTVAGPSNPGALLTAPVAAIAADGDAAVAWDQGSDGGPDDVYEADLPATTAGSQGALENEGPVSTNSGDGTALESTSQEHPGIAMKSSTAGDDTTALGFYDTVDDRVAALIRPSGDYGTSWSGLLGSLYNTDMPGQDWVQEPSGDEAQPQIALASSAAGDDGPLTMLWTDGSNGVSSVTSDSSGTFASPVALSSSRSEGDCDTANGSCTALAANPSGDVAALWQQADASSHTQVVADCYQASASVTVTTSSDPAACDSLTATTTTTTGTTTTGTTATTGTTTTPATTPTDSTPTATAAATTPTQTSTTPATPRVAKSIVVSSLTGTMMVIVPGSNTPVPLSSLQSIPNGSVIEPGGGTVTLTFALPDGRTETGSFWGGEFKVVQAPGGGVSLTLAGGSFNGCPTPPKHKSKKKPKLAGSVAKARKPPKKKPGSTVRSLWSNAKGNFTTKGSNGAAAVLGTTWLTRDQCDGTYFYVKSTSNDPRAAIEVTVLHPHRHKVKLRRGHHLVAPAPGYSS
ncbi:MAG TPA: hypothetical protein VHU61_19205 [Solirubrobacteraceae bacterium]|nr:hypothetical protein [Solirubrobacteraceae bacterium]